jgi:hypothetical protein
MRIATVVVLGAASLALAACSKPPEPPAKPLPPPEDVINMEYQEMPATSGYTLRTCVVCDKDFSTLGHPPLVIAYKNYEVHVCDKKCLKGFSADPQGIIRAKINPKAMFDH